MVIVFVITTFGYIVSENVPALHSGRSNFVHAQAQNHRNAGTDTHPTGRTKPQDQNLRINK